MTEHGIEAKLVDYAKNRSNLVSEIANGEGKTLALSGHMDVVSAGDKDAWTVPPFSGEIKDDIIWGRGASDMKSGLAALVIAFIEVKESGNFKGKLKLLLTVGEEVGELGADQLTKEGYVDDVDGIIIGEPCNIGVAYSHKGAVNYTVKSKGLAAHSSSPESGVNAIENLLFAMTEIKKAIAEKTKDIRNKSLGKVYHSITLMEGGTQINSIPDYAEFQANARTIPEFSNDKLMEEVKKVVDELNKKDKFDLAVEFTLDLLPVESDSKSDLVKAILASAKEIESLSPNRLIENMARVLGVNLATMKLPIEGDLSEFKEPIPMSIGGGTDAAQFIKGHENLQIAVYGPGIAPLNHKIDERIDIGQYIDFIEVYKKSIEKFLK